MASGDEDEEVDIEGSTMQASQLDCVTREDNERQVDQMDLMRNGGRCTLCEMENLDTDGIGSEIAKVFEMEEEQQRKMPANARYEMVRRRITAIIEAAEEVPEGLSFKFIKPSLQNVRLHFRDHEKSNLRQVYKIIDYFEESVEELKHGPLWQQNSLGGPREPQFQPTHMLFRYTGELQKLYLHAERLERERKARSAGVRKHATPVSRFTRKRMFVKPPGAM